MNLLFSNIFCSFFQEKSILHILKIAKNYVFRVFLEIMKNGLKYLVVVTPSFRQHVCALVCLCSKVFPLTAPLVGL